MSKKSESLASNSASAGPRGRWGRFRKWQIAVLAIVVLLVAIRLALPYFVKNYVNEQLNQDPLYAGGVEDVHLHLWRGAYSADGFRLERVKGQHQFPLVSASVIEIGLGWKELFHGTIRARIEIHELEVNIVQEPAAGGEKKVQLGQATKEGKKAEAQDWKATFRNLVPIDVGRLLIVGKSIHYRDLTSNPKIDVFLDQLRIQAENLTNSQKVSRSLFGTIDAKARVMRSGELHLVARANPLATPPKFKVTAEMKGLELVKLNDFFVAYGGFDVKQGTMGLSAEIAAADNKLEGYVKPIIRDLSVSDLKKDTEKGGVLHAAWEVIVGAVGGIFKSHMQNNPKQAAKLEFSGRLDDPNFHVWAAITSVFRNAFISPIHPGVEHTVDLKEVEKK